MKDRQDARREAAQALELRQHLWPHTPKAENPAGEVETWATLLLSTYSLKAVIAAMRACRGREYAPTLGQIEEMLDDTPTFGDAFSAMKRGDDSHPIVADLIRRGLRDEWRMGPDVTYGGSATAYASFMNRLREGYESARRRHDRTRVGIIGPTSGELVAAEPDGIEPYDSHAEIERELRDEFGE